jgi:hypothetical protein
MVEKETEGAGRHPVLWRIALFVMVLAGICWLGALNMRAIIGNDMLRTGTLEFDELLPPDAEREIFRLLSLSSLVVIIAYAVTLVSSIVFLVSSPFRLKEHGWLMMGAILFYVFVPVEVYTLVLDGRIVYNEFFTTADNALFRELFLARVGALAGAPLIALLCYYTAIGLAIFRPFVKLPGKST